MIIDKSLIIEAKEKFGDKAANIIAKDLKIQEFDEERLRGLCFNHKEDTPSLIWNNKESCFHCFSCNINYGIIDHYMRFNKLTYLGAVEKLFKETGIKFKFGEKDIKTVRDYQYPHLEQTEDLSIAKKYWELRKISENTLRYAGIGQDEHGNTVFHYYDTNDVLCNVKYRPSKKIDKKDKTISKFWTQKGADTLPLLYGMNKIDSTQPLVICEGEADYLSIIESGYRNVVSVPFGAGYKKITNIEKEMFTWIEFNFEWLQQFEKVIIWFDNDMVGMKGRKEASSRLGNWRTYYVDLPLELEDGDGNKHSTKDANEVLFWIGGQKILDLINTAKEIPVQNVVDLSEVDDFDIENAGGLHSGLKAIDDIVYKFIYGSVVILTGRKGSGKSTFLNQVFVCEALNQGEDVFVFSGELGHSVVKSWVECTMIGKEYIKMKNKFVRILDKTALIVMRQWYKGRLWIYDGIGNNAEDILNTAMNLRRKYGVKIWVLDNLMTLDIGVTGDSNQWLKQKEFIVKLVGLANTYGVLIVLVSHPRKMGGLEIDRRLGADDVAGSGDLGNLAQYIVGVHRFSEREKKGEKDNKGGYKKGHEPINEDVAVSIMKNRYIGKISEAKFYFDYESYRFFQSGSELTKRYNWNKSTEEPPKFDMPNNAPPMMQD